MHLPLEKARNGSNGHQTTSLLIYSEVTELGGGLYGGKTLKRLVSQ